MLELFFLVNQQCKVLLGKDMIGEVLNLICF
jgi:hypothetical protein